MELIKIITYFSIYVGLIATTFFILSFFADKKNKKKLFNDKELPSVTIIIPAFNEEKSIAKTIESICDSNYPNKKMEVIVIDDGSKDDTYKIAKKYIGTRNGKLIKVIRKKNGGKGSALNLGISKASSPFIFSMDADTFVDPDAVKEMMRYFKDEQVMSVSSTMMIYKPKTFLQKIQHIEYLFGIFLRKSFASINSIYVTPGAFSAYRKSFFDKYGGYIGMESNNLTEDLEMAMRIHYYGYKIENSSEALVYTLAPGKFKELTKQRKRWYIGLIKNTWKYKELFGTKYGDLGTFVFPVAWISIFFSLVMVIYLIIDSIKKAIREIIFLNSINYHIDSSLKISLEALQRSMYIVFSNPSIIFLILFIILLGVYLNYARKKVGDIGKWRSGLILYFILFALFFGFWWLVSIFELIIGKKTKWR